MSEINENEDRRKCNKPWPMGADRRLKLPNSKKLHSIYFKELRSITRDRDGYLLEESDGSIRLISDEDMKLIVLERHNKL